MAFTGTIQDITLTNDQISVQVLYEDSATGFNTIQTLRFPGTYTQAEAVADITALGQALKANLNKNNTLKSKIGTVITIN